MDEVTQPGIHWMQPFVTEMVALRQGHFKIWTHFAKFEAIEIQFFNYKSIYSRGVVRNFNPWVPTFCHFQFG